MTMPRVTPHADDRRVARRAPETPPIGRIAALPAPAVVRPLDVHKTRRDALLLHSWTRSAEHRFAVRARWSSDHPFYPAARTPDPMTVLETLRQAVILVAHVGYDVPRSAAFVMGAISTEIAPGAGFTPRRSVMVEVSCGDVVLRGGGLRSLRATVVFRVGGRVIARGTGDLVALRAETYRRIRSGRPAIAHASGLTRLAAPLVGCATDGDVVLSRLGPDSWRLALDTAHPYLFDHANDHVPGMVLLEAARQAHAVAHPARSVRSVEAVFHRYAEFEPDVELRLADPTRPAQTCVEAYQGDTMVARFCLTCDASPLAA